jgi:hypothetical protein
MLDTYYAADVAHLGKGLRGAVVEVGVDTVWRCCASSPETAVLELVGFGPIAPTEPGTRIVVTTLELVTLFRPYSPVAARHLGG